MLRGYRDLNYKKIELIKKMMKTRLKIAVFLKVLI